MKNNLFIYSFKGLGCDILFKKISIWLICKNKKNENCGLCKNCNLMLIGNHPDFLIINNKKNKKNIDIDYINKLIDYIYIKAQEDSIKIIYFEKIELLTEFAIYKLLKILEIKKKNIFFLIKCNKFSNSILNIKKFCFYLNLNFPEEKISLNWLKKKHKKNINEIKTALYLNNFSPLLANKTLSSNIWLKRKKLYDLIYKKLTYKNILYFLDILEFSDLNKYIYFIYTLIIDLIKIKQNCKYYILNKDKIKIIIYLSNLITLKNLYFLIKKIIILQYKIKIIKNINIKILLIEYLMYFKKKIKHIIM
ncbi:MAG: DNA polymerase III subunit delta' C-terminal domain-containing protein [Enterobacteriaceae bacterium]